MSISLHRNTISDTPPKPCGRKHSSNVTTASTRSQRRNTRISSQPTPDISSHRHHQFYPRQNSTEDKITSSLNQHRYKSSPDNHNKFTGYQTFSTSSAVNKQLFISSPGKSLIHRDRRDSMAKEKQQQLHPPTTRNNHRRNDSNNSAISSLSSSSSKHRTYNQNHQHKKYHISNNYKEYRDDIMSTPKTVGNDDKRSNNNEIDNTFASSSLHQQRSPSYPFLLRKQPRPQQRQKQQSSYLKNNIDNFTRECPYPETIRCIDDLRNAVRRDQRIIAIQNACIEFDHWDRNKHDVEIQCGAADALDHILSTIVRDLDLTINGRRHGHSHNDSSNNNNNEIRMVCLALELIFRNNSNSPRASSTTSTPLLSAASSTTKMIQHAYKCVGSSVVPMLLQLLDRCDSGLITLTDTGKVILSITKTLLYLSRVCELRSSLARRAGMIDALARVSTTSTLNNDCRTARLRVAVNLASCDDNKSLLFRHVGFIEGLLRVAALDEADTAREYATSVIVALSSCSTNQVPMTKITKLLSTLMKLSRKDSVAATRELAMTALQNLAFAKDNRVRLVSYSSGVVLEALKSCLVHDKNDKCRRKAAGVLTNLSCEETAEQIGSHKGLLETLAVVSTKDSSYDVQERASLALTKVASCISCTMSCHETLLDSLVVASLSKSTVNNNISQLLRVKAREQENRESMARHPGILDTLADMGISSDYDIKDRSNAMRAIMHLTNEPNNVRTMCNKTILESLVIVLGLEEDIYKEMRDSSIIAMERLATEISNRQYMARFDGLLVAVAKTTVEEAKVELQHQTSSSSSINSHNNMGNTLCNTANSKHKQQQNHHPFLAKPLLMSLLVCL